MHAHIASTDKLKKPLGRLWEQFHMMKSMPFGQWMVMSRCLKSTASLVFTKQMKPPFGVLFHPGLASMLLLQHPAPAWDPSQKTSPLPPPAAPSHVGPTMVNREQFRYEYDPSREAAQRREQINQAILCSACGVALGIPDVRPIKVTCPACLFEATYTE